MFCRFSSLTRAYPNLVFSLSYITLLAPMSDSFRPPSHQTLLCKFHYLPFITICILLTMCMVFLVSLPYLAMQISDFLSNITIGGSYGTKSGSLFENLFIIILKCARTIPAVHDALYSLSAI